MHLSHAVLVHIVIRLELSLTKLFCPQQRSQRFVVPTSLDPLLSHSTIPPVPNLPNYSTSSSSSSKPTSSSNNSISDPFFSFNQIPTISNTNNLPAAAAVVLQDNYSDDSFSSHSNSNSSGRNLVNSNPFAYPSSTSSSIPFATFPSSNSNLYAPSSTNLYTSPSISSLPVFRRGTIPMDNSNSTSAGRNSLPNEWMNKPSMNYGNENDYSNMNINTGGYRALVNGSSGNGNLNGGGISRREDEDV